MVDGKVVGLRRRWRRLETPTRGRRPSPNQRAWLLCGLDQPGGKLPLFDSDGRSVHPRTVRSCIDQGWAEPWFDNPTKPDWLICKLTQAGRAAVADKVPPRD